MEVISTEQLKEIIDSRNGKYMIVDVREPSEIEDYGAIPNAINIPYNDIPKNISKFKGKKVIFYCRSGGRSGRITEYALSQGIDAINYKGSVLEWSKIDSKVKAY